MQDLPDKATLLAGIAKFLDADVRPVIEDRATAFRVRIAAHLLGTVIREMQAEGTHDRAELKALQSLLGQPIDVSDDAQIRRKAIAQANRVLADGIRDGQIALDDAHPVLMEALAARLQVSNPRFDFDRDLP